MSIITRFPGGISSQGIPVLAGFQFYPPTIGSVWFVSSVTGNDANSGTAQQAPFATLGKALSVASATTGDVIILMPGHAEVLSGAAALAFSVNGVSVLGLGNGSLRPKLTLHTAPTTITITGIGVTIRNVQISGDITAIVNCLNVTGASCTLDAVDYVEVAACATLNFITCTGADLRVINSSWINSQTQSASAQQWILLNAAHRAKIINCFASLNGVAAGANGIVVGVTALSQDVEIGFNRFMSVGSVAAIGISMFAGTTGLVNDNHVATAKTAIAGNIALASCFGKNNFSSHVVNKNGLLDPVVDA